MAINSTGMDGRMQEIRTIYRDFTQFYEIAGGLGLVILGVLLGGLFFNQSGDYPTNLYTEFLSICLTVFVLDTRARHRDQRRRIDELRERLLREASSGVNETTKTAIEELAQRNLLTGETGWLQGADLSEANMNGVKLDSANLRGANLRQARLENATLFDTALDMADLSNAKLHGALLSYATMTYTALENADLRNASLQRVVLNHANLSYADLRGADLTRASLKFTRFTDTVFDDTTILPDGSHWSVQTDLTRFGAEIAVVPGGAPYLHIKPDGDPSG